jgi:hypothetical protein
MPGSPQWSLSLRFPHQHPVHASPLPHPSYMLRPSLYKKNKMSNFMKILSVGAESFYADRRTDRYDEANNRVSQLCESAQKSLILCNVDLKR